MGSPWKLSSCHNPTQDSTDQSLIPANCDSGRTPAPCHLPQLPWLQWIGHRCYNYTSPETIAETWQPPQFWTLTQTVSDIKSPLWMQFYVTVQIKLEPTLRLAKGNCIMVLSALKNSSASRFVCTDYS